MIQAVIGIILVLFAFVLLYMPELTDRFKRTREVRCDACQQERSPGLIVKLGIDLPLTERSGAEVILPIDLNICRHCFDA